ncbi:DHA2 family efflux MFS transporter permease subunit [Lactobacillus amylovorus]|uniref:DHA2 family efflux MFS transporter permease subunit n=1 Tax=Lactobacillus amylovorus TaxID=1604 RepID=A0A9X4AC55_LACAM|nr:DHA2 family efflux MFS transporter permease subunit [Lactobacillus amylovorus]MDB6261033.1 DHA2 family efflux MFS transporter permease subunit [Lactobacillus amylovorus]MDB6264216.1 DHA2 family efflux MFS transporter permease subunit [Lactobacillus amylovorus]
MVKSSDKIPAKVFAAIVATGLMSFCGVIVETSMNIAFPTLMREFGVSTNVISWMTSIYLLAISIIVPISAILKSSYKTKNLFLTANVLFLLGLIVDAIAPSFVFLLLGRVIQGIATGIALPLMFNIILEQVPKSKIGTMMGVGNLITGAAPALGPTFGGIIINNLGWRWVFYLLIPFIIISLLLGLWSIQQKSELVKQKIDVPGFLLIAIFFSGAIYGFSNLSSGNILEIVLPLIFVVIAAILLVRRTKSLEHPLLKLDLFKNKYFAATVLGFFLIQMISLGNAFLLPNYIQLTNNSTAMTAGLLVLPAGAVGAIMGPIGGNLLDKHGARNVTLAGVYLMIAELAIFAIFSRNMSNIFIMLVYILYMGGMGMILGNVMTYALSRIDKKWVTQGNAILSTVQQFAGAVGTSVTSAIVAVSQNAFHSKAGMPTAIGTQHAFIFLLIVAIIIWALFFKYVKDKH